MCYDGKALPMRALGDSAVLAGEARGRDGLAAFWHLPAQGCWYAGERASNQFGGMAMDQSGFGGMVKSLDSLKWRVILKGILVGIAAGTLVVGYRLVIEFGTEKAVALYNAIRINPVYLLLWIALAVVAGFILQRLIRWEPYAKGSGIPQVEGMVLHGMRIKWHTVLVTRFLAGSISSLFGVSLGREGPSIQIGAAGAQAIIGKQTGHKLEKNYLITAGASAGLSAAFNAPLSAIVFSLEEVHRSFSPNLLLATTSAALTADVLAKTVFGLKPVLSFTVIPQLPLACYALLPLLGVLAGLLGALTNRCLLDISKLYAKLPVRWHPFAALLLALPCGLLLPQVLGGGQGLIQLAEQAKTAVPLLLLLLFVKLVFTSTSFGSGLPGGIFMPILAIGALTGGIFARLLMSFGIPADYAPAFCVCAMAGVMAGCVKAPVTSILLMVEMTGSVVHLLPLATVAFIALLTSDLLKISPIYEQLLERLLGARDENQKTKKKGAMTEIPVELGSPAADCRICEMNWPKGALIVSIRRGGQDLVPDGDTRIQAGDFLTVVSTKQTFDTMNSELAKLCRTPPL